MIAKNRLSNDSREGKRYLGFYRPRNISAIPPYITQKSGGVRRSAGTHSTAGITP
jgi:hypothetical protein